jgi:hypothetical protein
MPHILGKYAGLLKEVGPDGVLPFGVVDGSPITLWVRGKVLVCVRNICKGKLYRILENLE